MTSEHAKAIASVLKALAHPARLLVVEALATGRRSFGELVGVWNVGQSTMSRHLAALVGAGIVQEHRDGRRAVYGLGPRSILKCLDCVVCVMEVEARQMRKALRGVGHER